MEGDMTERHSPKMGAFMNIHVFTMKLTIVAEMEHPNVRAISTQVISPSASASNPAPTTIPRSVRAPHRAPPASTARVALTSPAAARAKPARRASGPSASAAGVSTTDVVIVSIKETLRRSGSIDVETNIIAADSAGADTVSTTLGSGDALKGKLTTSLQAEGLQAPTGVTDPPSTGTCNKQCDKIVADTEVTSVYGGKVLHLKIRHPDIGEAV